MQSCPRRILSSCTRVPISQQRASFASKAASESEYADIGPSNYSPRACADESSTSQTMPKRRGDRPSWLVQKEALKKNFPQGWNPPKKISRPSMALLKTLHQRDPQQFPLPVLADKFKISPEAVRRILRSKWEPDQSTAEKLHRRAEKTSTGAVDGWVYHEKLETDQIPSNLAHSLQSSMIKPTIPYQGFQSRSRHFQKAEHRSYPQTSGDFRPTELEQTTPKSGIMMENSIPVSDTEESLPNPPKQESRRPTRAKPDSTLGSAFQQTSPFHQKRRSY